MKTYVLIVSERFAKSHSKAGQYTGFPFAIEIREKIHTIRANYEFWEKRFKQIEKGNAVLSLRTWTGKPYRSKQKELFRYDKNRGIGLEKIALTDQGFVSIGNKIIDVNELANNDGLTKSDFVEWFKDYTGEKPMAVIHFTNYRYCA